MNKIFNTQYYNVMLFNVCAGYDGKEVYMRINPFSIHTRKMMNQTILYTTRILAVARIR